MEKILGKKKIFFQRSFSYLLNDLCNYGCCIAVIEMKCLAGMD